MKDVETMLATHPRSPQTDPSALEACIRACYACAQSCTACADACLGEAKVAELVRCIRLDLDCFDVCVSTGNVLSRQTEPDRDLVRAQLEACVAACRACGAECESHAEHHVHCRVCAEACRHCEEACRQVLQAFG
jgi:hypothetical protein